MTMSARAVRIAAGAAAVALAATTVSAAVALAATTASATKPKPGFRPAIERYEAAAPAVGDPMPDLAVYDAQGEPIDLGELLRENYTVLVLGCLT